MNPTTETTLRFTGDWPVLPVFALATGLALLMLLLYRREVRLHPGPLAWVPAILRSLAVFILILALAGPVMRHVTTFRQLGRVIIAVDASASMKLTDAVAGEASSPATESSRWQRLERLLFDGASPLIGKLTETQDVELTVLRGTKAQRVWWRRQEGKDVSGEMPRSMELQPDSPLTSLDQALRESLGPISPGTALIVLSDGQHNAPGSPEEFATAMRESGVPIFTVGFGTEIPPADLSLVDLIVPESVFSEEQLQGRVMIQDSMPPGVPSVVRIQSQGKTMWEQVFQTDGKGERRFDFAFPVRELPIAAASDADKTLRTLSVQVAATGDQAALEKTRANNAREVAVHLLTKKRKLLVLDGRPRWETRYIHNHFDRDERWSASIVFDDLIEDAAKGAIQLNFPKTRDDLFTYDLVLVGDVSPKRFKAEQIEWLVEFVEKRGGGLIFVDGSRGHLGEWSTLPSGLLPVERAKQSTVNPEAGYTWYLESDGERVDALKLSDSASANASLWPSLPASRWAAEARPLPGAVTLATLRKTGATALPAVVFRPQGAGAVLYLASDELWRWRYQVSDLYHQRLWMQLSSWIAAPPFQAEDKKISLGTDHLRYASGEQAEIRVRLRNDRGEMIVDGQPRASLMHQGTEVATLALEPDPTHAGVYRAITPPLKPGSYEISVAEAPGTPASSLRLSLRVDDAGNQEWASLTLNRPLLETMASNSGGRFLREEQAAAELPGLLQSIDRKQTTTRETILWSSWWWFGAVILMLTAEWLLRKRLRLV